MSKSMGYKNDKKDTKDSKGGAGNVIKDKVREKEMGTKADTMKRRRS